MKKLRYKLNIQLFGDGGDGGASAGAEGTGAEATAGNIGTEIPANIPERAKKIYEKAMLKVQGKVDTGAKASHDHEDKKTVEKEEKPQKPSFAELMKDEEYRTELDREKQKAIKDRFKTHNAELERYKSILEKDARKYGIDTASEGYLDELEAAMDKDDSYYERYADEHDVSIETAKRMVGTEQQLEKMRQQEKIRREQEENAKILSDLHTRAAETKKLYPNFDLRTEMQSPAFQRICAVTNGDTTAAYVAVHHKDILSATARKAAQHAQESTVNSIRAGQNRPSENGLSSKATTNTLPNFKDGTWTKDRLAKWADEQRRRKMGS